MARSLFGNSAINILGQGLPMVVAVFAIPRIIHAMGTDRFGVLTLAWLVIGYFSLFDLGLGRALTQMVAERRAHESPQQLARTVWTALAIMAAMGVVGGLIAAAGTSLLVEQVFKIPVALQAEARISFYLVAGAIPVVVISAGLVGLLTAYGRFGLINLLRLPLGLSNFVVPLLVLPFSTSLVPIVVLLVAARLLATLGQFWCCARTLPGLTANMGVEPSAVIPLFRFGGWMTVSNLISPAMMYFDRFFIAALISVTAVAYYATPYEITMKMLIVPASVAAALFPIFAAHYRSHPEKTLQTFVQGFKAVFIVLFPAVAVAVALAPELLQLWLGTEFSRKSSFVTQWLAIGVFVNALAHVPFALMQGIGRPDLTAKAHIVEVCLYLPLLWWALHAHGINGAAVVWALRAALDAGLLSFFVWRHFPQASGFFAKAALGVLVAMAALLLLQWLPAGQIRLLSLALLLAVFGLTAWSQVLTPDERDAVARPWRVRAAA